MDNLVYSIALCEQSPCRDVYKLKYEFSVPEFWRLKHALENHAKMKYATYLDDEYDMQEKLKNTKTHR